ncbi:MAG: DNA repair protein RecN [Clostridia bacterium]|nr:DNA repair protein RecN [Clostridia bacterium]
MIERLHIENIALIRQLDIELADGFNVLTGETGAGKSIIVDSIALVIGERASRDLIKSGASKGRVEALFDISRSDEARAYLESLDIEVNGEVMVSRELYATGKSVCRIEGIPVGVAALKGFTSRVIDLHGQHEHQSLLQPSRHVKFIDAFGGDALADCAHAVAALYDEYKRVKEQLDSEFMPEDERMRRIDILQYQVKEIEAASLTEGEEEELEAEQAILANAERIVQRFSHCYEYLNEGDRSALDLLRGAMREAEAVSDMSPAYAEIAARLSDTFYLLQEVSYSVREIRDTLEYDPERLNAIGERLYALTSLKRKYGASVPDVIAFGERAKAELQFLTQADARRDVLTTQLERLASEYYLAAGSLRQQRRKAADEVERLMVDMLGDLGMRGVVFEVRMTDSDGIAPSGIDKVEFFISTNKGEESKPLSRIASGGEISRIMLALKTIIAGADGVDTMVFDEIDTGISGRISASVGEKMLLTSRNRQVLCVTHSPQIAAFADRHILVEKRESTDETHTTVRSLGDDERPAAIAAIMGAAAESELALRHAEELLLRARERSAELLRS